MDLVLPVKSLRVLEMLGLLVIEIVGPVIHLNLEMVIYLGQVDKYLLCLYLMPDLLINQPYGPLLHFEKENQLYHLRY